jgi:anti-anti-sigma factor
MDFHISVSVQADDIVVIRLAGELDLATAEQTREALRATDLTTTRSLVVDLSALTFCDSSGLRLLVQLHHVTVAHGGAFDVVGAHGIVADAIDLTGLTEILYERPRRDARDGNWGR